MNILIIVSYVENVNQFFAKSLSENSDFIICADAGQLIAKTYDIKPDLCVGDFDSTDSVNVDKDNPGDLKNYMIFDCEYITYSSKKNFTDAEAAIDEAISRFPACELNISVLGGIGGRLDHTIGAINTIRKYSSRRVNIRLVDLKNTVSFISSDLNNHITIKVSKYYKYFSLIPYTDEVLGVTVKGARYNLDNFNMKRLGSLGISNEIAEGENETAISISKGDLLVIRSSD